MGLVYRDSREVQGSGYRVQGVWYGVWVLRSWKLRIEGSGCRVWGVICSEMGVGVATVILSHPISEGSLISGLRSESTAVAISVEVTSTNASIHWVGVFNYQKHVRLLSTPDEKDVICSGTSHLTLKPVL